MTAQKRAEPSNYGVLGVGTNGNLYTRDTLESNWVAVGNTRGTVKAVTIMQDGRILAVGTNGNLYTRAALKSNWVAVGNTRGEVKDVTIMQDGKILAVGTNGNLYTRDTLESNWVAVGNTSGTVNAVTAMQDGKILAVGTNGNLYTRDTLESNWVAVRNTSGTVKAVTVMQDGKILAVGTNGNLYTRDTLESSWVAVRNTSGEVKAVTPYNNSLHELRLEAEGYTWCMVESENWGDYCNLTVSGTGDKYISFNFQRLQDRTDDAFVVIDPDGNVYNSASNGGGQNGYPVWATEAYRANGLQSFFLKDPKPGVWSAKITRQVTDGWRIFGTTSPLEDYQQLANSAFGRATALERARIADALVDSDEDTARYGVVCIGCQAQMVAIMGLVAAALVYWVGPAAVAAELTRLARRMYGFDAPQLMEYLGRIQLTYSGWNTLKNVPFDLCKWEGLCRD